ncbi:signal peptidase I [Lysinibacillus fusiformis]|nr:signal peptidase I [Lysinibacillus fusiformis]
MTKGKNELLEWGKALITALLIVVIVRYILFTPIVVDGESMMPTLIDGDRMIVNKLDYKVSDIKRFDIIVFHTTEEEDYIKRVIGLPGDHIEYKEDTLYINGKAYKEPYLDESKKNLNDGGFLTESFTLEDTPVASQTVPEGYLFVMGDNRRFSKDSRHIGAIPINEIVGKTNLVFWPISDIHITK